jgi:HAD superfamily hydrolase (TIGR01549 family)
MFYKGIIFDLDNTLYDYDRCHNFSIEIVFDYINNKYNKICDGVYNKVSNELKNEVGPTASSHNKSIYFKHLLENLTISLSVLPIIEELYWNNFYKHMECYTGVREFIEWNKKQGKKIGVLTDYETQYQIVKLKQLGILDYIDVIVTSEEVGIEKPSVQMFQTILHKLKLQPENVIMIGDNYKKDIEGANRMGIYGYHYTSFTPLRIKNEQSASLLSLINANKLGVLNEKRCKNTHEQHETYEEFSDFTLLHSKMRDISSELNKLKKLSKYVGERFDLVQAGGGNTSVKLNNIMYIKESGVHLTTIDESNGYVVIDNHKLMCDIENNNTKDVLQYNLFGNKKRGSIETFMHSILKEYTVHIHPIQTNRILVSNEARQICNKLFPKALVIDYVTPGIKVCNEIKNKYNGENLIFLINHGIIITSDKIEDIYYLLEDVINKYTENDCIFFEKYKRTNEISKQINDVFCKDNDNDNNYKYVISYLCDDEVINKYYKEKRHLFIEKPAYPDALIYCGVIPLFSIETNDINEYKKKYNETPKIVIYKEHIYIISHSLQKCKEIEDVFKSNLMIMDSIYDKNYLSTEEICYLNNWDAEKYRKLL